MNRPLSTYSIPELADRYPEQRWIASPEAFRYTRKEDIHFLLRLISDTGARTILEIGTNRGHTTRLLALAFPEAQIYTIDFAGDEDWALVDRLPAIQKGEALPRALIGELIRPAIPSYPKGRVVQLYGDSHDLRNYPPFTFFDFCFIDGSHRYEDVLLDTLICQQLGTERLTLVWHDATHPGLGTRPALELMRDSLNIRWVRGTDCALASRMDWVQYHYESESDSFPPGR